MIRTRSDLLFVLFCCTIFRVFGADVPITGMVRDAETGEPLPFTSIGVEGRHAGTVSNAEGYFILHIENLGATDTIVFSYMGYVTLKVPAAELKGEVQIRLVPAPVNLLPVAVYDRQLTAQEIIDLVRDNYERNHPKLAYRQRLFIHKFEQTPWPEENQLILKKSDFVGIDQHVFNAIKQKIPREFIEYRDAVLDDYSDGEAHKLLPVEGISLEERSMQTLSNEMQSLLGTFFDDVQKTNADDQIYYKFRSGIFAMKADQPAADSIWSQQKEDTLNYIVPMSQVKSDFSLLMDDYGRIESKNWEFLTRTGRYDYKLEGVTVFNEEYVFQISFTPHERGLFEGTVYISMDTYAILQLDFAYAAGRQNENFHLMGIGHSMNSKKGSVIFEKGENGYFVKYIYAQQHETGSIDRSFSVMKKEKRFLWDKELNEIKLEAQLSFDIRTHWELLVLSREEADLSSFGAVKQPATMKFRKEYTYTPDMWKERTVIAPVSELRKYKRGE